MKKHDRFENKEEFLLAFEVAQLTSEDILELKQNEGFIQYDSNLMELSLLERNYQFTLISLSGMIPGIKLLQKTRRRMFYMPDERRRTLKTIGKISLGLSPP